MRSTQCFVYLRHACLAACVLTTLPCLAAPEEIQVYLDEFADQGKFGLDIHTGYVLGADAGPGSRDMLRVTPELSYGINEHWEGALYVLTSSGPEQEGGRPGTDGVKLRLKWRPRAPSADSPWYGAINFEIGELATRFYPDRSSGEVKFIGVWRSGPWLAAGNVNVGRSLRSDAAMGATLDVDFKLAYRLTGEDAGDVQLGVEHYAGLGQLKSLYAADDRTSMTFLVVDFDYKDWDFNIGIGHADAATQNNNLIKAIIGVPF